MKIEHSMPLTQWTECPELEMLSRRLRAIQPGLRHFEKHPLVRGEMGVIATWVSNAAEQLARARGGNRLAQQIIVDRLRGALARCDVLERFLAEQGTPPPPHTHPTEADYRQHRFTDVLRQCHVPLKMAATGDATTWAVLRPALLHVLGVLDELCRAELHGSESPRDWTPRLRAAWVQVVHLEELLTTWSQDSAPPPEIPEAARNCLKALGLS